MADMIDNTQGFDAFAFNPNHPDAAGRWHMKGRPMPLGTDGRPVLDDDALAAVSGLNYSVDRSRVRYATALNQGAAEFETWDASHVIFRRNADGTCAPLAVVSDSYVIHHQPVEAIAEIRRQAEMIGADLSTLMALNDGRRIVATAKLDAQHSVFGSSQDIVRGYMTYASAYDGTMRTEQFFTDICVVCANTLAAARGKGANKGMVKTSHKSVHDTARVDLEMGLNDFAERMRKADEMARAPISPEQTSDFLARVYLETSEEEARANSKTAAQLQKLLSRVMPQVTDAPGQGLSSRRGTVWGAFNAVTHDVDHVGTSRTNDARTTAAMFGVGAQVKARAWTQALALAA